MYTRFFGHQRRPHHCENVSVSVASIPAEATKVCDARLRNSPGVEGFLNTIRGNDSGPGICRKQGLPKPIRWFSTRNKDFSSPRIRHLPTTQLTSPSRSEETMAIKLRAPLYRSLQIVHGNSRSTSESFNRFMYVNAH